MITYKRPIGDAVPVLVVETEDGKFRQPGQININTLHEADTHRLPIKDRMKRSAQYMEESRAAQRKRAADEIRQRTVEDRRQLMPRFARIANDGGKNNSTFDRIKPKVRGKVFK